MIIILNIPKKDILKATILRKAILKMGMPRVRNIQTKVIQKKVIQKKVIQKKVIQKKVILKTDILKIITKQNLMLLQYIIMIRIIRMNMQVKMVHILIVSIQKTVMENIIRKKNMLIQQ